MKELSLISYQADELHYKYSAREEKLAVFFRNIITSCRVGKCMLTGRESVFPYGLGSQRHDCSCGDHEINSLLNLLYYVGNNIAGSSILLILLFAGYLTAKIKMNTKSEIVLVHHSGMPYCASET